MALSLQKREETFKLSLAKKKIAKITACVASAFDISGSMSGVYAAGTMTEFVARLMPLGLRFDDNGEIDNWIFDNSSKMTGPIVADNYETFVDENVAGHVGGGTSFAPVLQSIFDHYFTEVKGGFFRKKKEAAAGDKPVYLIMQTDGENDDKPQTDHLLAALEKKNIYVQFVGIGTGTNFKFIRDMGDKYSNVGFFHVEDLAHVTDDELYSMLINDEFKEFMKTRFPKYIEEV